MNLYRKKAFLPSLNKTTWRVGVSPWAGMKTECLRNKTCDAGLEIDFLTTIAKLLNANLEFVESRTTGCGSKNAKGEWTGLMSLLENDEIDITGNTCSINEWRIDNNFSQFSFPIIQDKQNFLIKIPKSTYGFEIGGPFELAVWYSLLAFFIIFFFIYTLAIKVECKLSILTAVKDSFAQMTTVITGADNPNQSLPVLWFIWTSAVGYFLMLYNTYITGILFVPVPISKPFENNIQLAAKIFDGEYKIFDYRKPFVSPVCYDAAVCNMLKQGVTKHGYRFQQIGEKEQDVKDFLNIILESENLVYFQAKQYIDFFLSDFLNKTEFWLYDDELAPETWYTYYFRKNFAHKRLLYNALILVGEYKTNIFKRYWKSSMFVHQEKKIKGMVSSKMTVSFMIISKALVFFSVGMTTSIVVLGFELLFKQTTC